MGSEEVDDTEAGALVAASAVVAAVADGLAAKALKVAFMLLNKIVPSSICFLTFGSFGFETDGGKEQQTSLSRCDLSARAWDTIQG